MKTVLPAHGKNDHRCNGPDPIPVLLHVKTFADTATVVTGNDARRVAITDDLGGTSLRSAQAYVTTVSSSGALTIMVRNVTEAQDMLSTAITIDASEFTSYTAAQSVPDATGTPPLNYVSRGDIIAIDVDAAGTGAKGLEVLLEFGPSIIRLTP